MTRPTEVEPEVEYLMCPFCKEDDFDAEGLRTHLLHDCVVYASLQSRPRLFT